MDSRSLGAVRERRVCGRCRRAWGSALVPPPDGHYSLLNVQTGVVHAEYDRGPEHRTVCGLATQVEGWERV